MKNAFDGHINKLSTDNGNISAVDDNMQTFQSIIQKEKINK